MALGNRNIFFSSLVFTILAISFCVPVGNTEGRRYRITIQNSCPYPVWPAWITTGAGRKEPVCPGGTFLNESMTYKIYPSTVWNATFWARTGCSFNSSTMHGNCSTGNCNGSYGCKTLGKGPITTAEFVFDNGNPINQVSYRVSLLKGFNVPIQISTNMPNNTCKTLDCPCDVKQSCMQDLDYTVGSEVVGCLSPCEKFNTDEFCCRGNYSGPACAANKYSNNFKSLCNKAVTFPNDFNNGTQISCSVMAEYTITFCPETEAEVTVGRATM